MKPRHFLPMVAGHAMIRSAGRVSAVKALRIRPSQCLAAASMLPSCLLAATSTRKRSKSEKPDRGKPARAGRTGDFGHPAHRVTDVLLVINAACFAVQLFTPRLFLLGAKVNSKIAAGEVWRLVTPAFLHGSWIHLGVNSYALWHTGRQMEQLSNRGRFLAIYLAGAVGGTLLSYLRSPVPAVGASGAIFGLMGAMGVFLVRHKAFLGADKASRAIDSLLQTLVLNGILGMSSRIDSWGHLGGLLGGAAAAYLLGPKWIRNPKTGITSDKPPVPLLAGPPLF